MCCRRRAEVQSFSGPRRLPHFPPTFLNVSCLGNVNCKQPQINVLRPLVGKASLSYDFCTRMKGQPWNAKGNMRMHDELLRFSARLLSIQLVLFLHVPDLDGFPKFPNRWPRFETPIYLHSLTFNQPSQCWGRCCQRPLLSTFINQRSVQFSPYWRSIILLSIAGL